MVGLAQRHVLSPLWKRNHRADKAVRQSGAPVWRGQLHRTRQSRNRVPPWTMPKYYTKRLKKKNLLSLAAHQLTERTLTTLFFWHLENYQKSRRVCTKTHNTLSNCSDFPSPLLSFVTVNGGWCNWTDSGCPLSCGGLGQALLHRARTCNCPAPDHGGENCTGDHAQDVDCGTPTCPREHTPRNL